MKEEIGRKKPRDWSSWEGNVRRAVRCLGNEKKEKNKGKNKNLLSGGYWKVDRILP